MLFIRLMPLLVPGGWIVIKNNFVDEDFIVENGRIVNESYFSEDLLSIEKATLKEGLWQNDLNGFCLDLGWLPEADPSGAFHFSFLSGNWENILFQVRSTDRYYIKQVIERCLWYGTLNLSADEIRRRLEEEFNVSET